MTPGFAPSRAELPWLYYPESDRVIINAHNFTAVSTLKTGLAYWWDCASADASITDQHSGLVLTQGGTGTSTVTGGAPDGGDCFSVNGSGWYRNASVAARASHTTGFSQQIWYYRTSATIGSGHFLLSHRSASAPWYTQMAVTTATKPSGYLLAQNGTFRGAIATANNALNAWEHHVITDDGTTFRLYVNGTLAVSDSTVIGARSTANAPYAIGTGSWDTAATQLRARGRIAMAGHWDKVLTTTEITELYNGGAGKRYAAL